jgi:ABC-2 type transport system permease protein
MNHPAEFYKLMLWAQIRALSARGAELRKRSAFLIVVLFVFILGYLVIGYLLFFKGLEFIASVAVIGGDLSRRILYLIFLFFFFMLLFSNIIIGYTTFYRSRETAWLLTLPVPHAWVYRWKFLETTAVASWALLFLFAPLMLAYGQVLRAPPQFYFEVLLGLVPFLIIPAAFASWIVVAVAKFLSSRAFKVLIIGLGILAALLLFAGIRPVTSDQAANEQDAVAFNLLLKNTQISLNPTLPSTWMTRAVLGWCDAVPAQAWFYFLLLASNAAVVLLVCHDVVGRAFYSSWLRASHNRAHRLQKAGWERLKAVSRLRWLDRLVGALPTLDPSTKAMMLKDIRLFWRDPVQWSQFTIFFGLLAIYIANLRNVAADFTTPLWAVIISFLNLGASALTLSTLTTRFVFPQFSLEGRRLWILGMAPVGLVRVVKQKFFFSAVSAGTITLGLIVASSLMLNLAPSRVLLFAATIIIMSASLSAIAVGLGTLFPNLREDNPSKIVSGVGGTLCLVLSFIYILLMMACLILPAAVSGPEALLKGTVDPVIAAGATLTALLLSACACFIPLKLAFRKAATMEI